MPRPQKGQRFGGRQKGTPNKATAARAAAVAKSGLTPLEYLLSVMRNTQLNAVVRIDAAKAAAPYVHPKLANVDHSSSDGTMTPKPTKIIIEAATSVKAV
jgi:hypothetical protein